MFFCLLTDSFLLKVTSQRVLVFTNFVNLGVSSSSFEKKTMYLEYVTEENDLTCVKREK